MKIFIPMVIALLLISGCCRNDETSPERIYLDRIYAEWRIDVSTVEYGIRSNFNNLQYTSFSTKLDEINNEKLTLTMDIYIPPNAGATTRQPLLVMIHGGDFKEGGKSQWENEAYSYARAGYVCATLNYRLTKNGGRQSKDLRLYAVKCALEDVQNGIRFLKNHADRYFIDTSRIIVMGSDAGGLLSLLNAVEYDMEFGKNDFPDYSSKTNGSISTGTNLSNDDPAITSGWFHYDSYDSPILMFHARENDSGGYGWTWSDNAVPTRDGINDSGNSCTLIAQPDMTHIISLDINSEYWIYLKPFLYENLRLGELVD